MDTLVAGRDGGRQALGQQLRAATQRPGWRRTGWVILSVWTTLWALIHAPGGGYSWHYFSQAARIITGSGPGTGLHIYAAHPELQMGPLTMLAAIPLRAISPSLGNLIAPALLTLSGPALLWVLVRAREARTGPISPTMLMLTGLFALPVWTEVTTHYAHLDDVLAMTFGIAALIAARNERPVLTGLLLAAAVDSKPWALGFCLLLLTLNRSARLVGAVVTAVAIAVAWLPFILADPGTLSLTHFRIDNVDDSALRALGVHTASTPGWDRPAQFLLGAAAALLAIRRRRTSLVLLMVVAGRLLLDPETYPYYTSGLVIAAAAADLLTQHRRLPLWTAACALWYMINELLLPVAPAAALGGVRAAFCLALMAAVTFTPEAADSAAAYPTDSTERQRVSPGPTGGGVGTLRS